MTLITRYSWIYPLKLKSETYGVFVQFISLMERQFSIKVKNIQTDWGGEFRKLLPYLNKLGIVSIHPCTHQQNGKIERKHRHITEMGLTLLANASMPLCY